MKKLNVKYWILIGSAAAALLAFLLYLIIRPFAHEPEDGIEQSNSNNKSMEKPDPRYDTSKRGYRNNNPLNIRLSSNNWKGEVKPSTDKSFCQFVNMAYGFRAAMCCIRTYIKKYNCNTLEAIINRWAPWSDGNNPVRYAQRVMNRWPETFPNKEVVIDFANKDQMTKLVYAMAIVENGSEPLLEDCYKAYDLYFI